MRRSEKGAKEWRKQGAERTAQSLASSPRHDPALPGTGTDLYLTPTSQSPRGHFLLAPRLRCRLEAFHMTKCVCVFITAVPITKLFAWAWGEGFPQC